MIELVCLCFSEEKTLNILFRTGQLSLCDNFFEKKVLKKTLWEYDLYKERSSIPYIC